MTTQAEHLAYTKGKLEGIEQGMLTGIRIVLDRVEREGIDPAWITEVRDFVAVAQEHQA